MNPVRHLPLRVRIGDGEALDSWLLRLAHRNQIPAQWLLPALGLDRLPAPWRNHALVWRLPAGILRRVETQTGLAPHTLDLAVLDGFDPLGWRPTVGSRYCVTCLAETGGQWPIRWRLPHVFACTRHRCLLAAVCPACTRTPHSSWSQQSGLLPSHRCGIRRKRGEVCGADLLTHPVHHLKPHDPRLGGAQEWVNQRLDAMDTRAHTELRDLDTVSTWFRLRTEPSTLGHLGRLTVDAVAEHRQFNPLQRHRPTAAIVAAAFAAQAVALLTAADHPTRYRRFVPLFRTAEHHTASGPPPAPLVLPRKRITTLSPALQHQLLTACDPHLAASERLRYRTCTTTPRIPEPGSTTAAERARHVPQYLWPDWIIRFRPPRGAYADTIATDIPIALLIPDNPLRNTPATAELSGWTPNASQTLRLLAEHHRDALTAICALTQYLDTHGAPIDYRRRRATFTDVAFSRRQWHDLCYRADADPGQGSRQRHARRYLFGLLTGADLSNPAYRLAFTSNQDKHAHHTFHRSLSTPLRDALHHHAAQLLHTAGIDEPLTWTPPADCVAGLTLPGRDPDDIDLDAVHQLVTVGHLNLAAAARKLGVSIDHIRYALQRTHRPAAGRRVRERAANQLTHAFFQREYVLARKTLATIEAETGIHRRLLADRARQLGIRLVGDPPNRPIDPDWLREQAETRRRTNSDIGAELGVTHETIRRYRTNFGITAGPRGVHNLQRQHHPDLPDDIRRAVEGQRHGWQRLRRFQQMMAHPSMNTAAQALGYHTSNLNLQLQRLEADIGVTLLHRGHRYQPMRPTRHGHRLLELLDQPAVRHLLDRYAKPPPGPPPRTRRTGR